MTICRDVSSKIICRTTSAGVAESLIAHYEYQTSTTGKITLHSTHYTKADGVTNVAVAATDVLTVGACVVAAVPAKDVELLQLCDTNTATGVVTPFVRRTITSFDSAGTPTTTSGDLTANFSGAYTITGTVGACATECKVLAPVGVVSTWG